MLIVGYISSVFIGILLGLMGGGGSILAVPILVYLLGVSPVYATAYSLFIVGSSSAFGVYTYFKDDLVSVRTAIVFGIPAIIGVYCTRRFIMPAIPESIFTIGDFELKKDMALMILFGIMMLLASISMIRNKAKEGEESEQKFNYPFILVEGLLVGVLTGLIGAGGGFIIIPALVILSKLPMKKAVGTSLAIITAKSLIGFLGDVHNLDLDWTLLATVTGLAVIGIFTGKAISRKIDGKVLKPLFGWFVLAMGVVILFKEFTT